MADNEQKGLDLMAQAEKKAKSTGGFLGGLFGTGSSKLEESAELYCRAGNSFKMGKKWAAAGDAYCRAAQVQIKMNSRHEAATQYVNASTCFKKADPNEAINCLLKAIEIYTDMGRFTMAAKHHISIAEMFETEVVDIDKAMAHYEQAADYYKGEESTSSANKCSLKVAQYAAQLEQYEKAIEIYEQVATSSMDNQLLRYGAKDYFFRAALCHLCVEILNGSNAIQRYKDMFPAFADSRESKLLEKLVGAGEEQNVDAFTEAVQEYDRISRLDQWHTTILLRVKKHVEGEPDLR